MYTTIKLVSKPKTIAPEVGTECFVSGVVHIDR